MYLQAKGVYSQWFVWRRSSTIFDDRCRNCQCWVKSSSCAVLAMKFHLTVCDARPAEQLHYKLLAPLLHIHTHFSTAGVKVARSFAAIAPCLRAVLTPCYRCNKLCWKQVCAASWNFNCKIFMAGVSCRWMLWTSHIFIMCNRCVMGLSVREGNHQCLITFLSGESADCIEPIRWIPSLSTERGVMPNNLCVDDARFCCHAMQYLLSDVNSP